MTKKEFEKRVGITGLVEEEDKLAAVKQNSGAYKYFKNEWFDNNIDFISNVVLTTSIALFVITIIALIIYAISEAL